MHFSLDLWGNILYILYNARSHRGYNLWLLPSREFFFGFRELLCLLNRLCRVRIVKTKMNAHRIWIDADLPEHPAVLSLSGTATSILLLLLKRGGSDDVWMV